jgi:hypothetical protein
VCREWSRTKAFTELRHSLVGASLGANTRAREGCRMNTAARCRACGLLRAEADQQPIAAHLMESSRSFCHRDPARPRVSGRARSTTAAATARSSDCS